jgi:hypothetical protein
MSWKSRFIKRGDKSFTLYKLVSWFYLQVFKVFWGDMIVVIETTRLMSTFLTMKYHVDHSTISIMWRSLSSRTSERMMNAFAVYLLKSVSYLPVHNCSLSAHICSQLLISAKLLISTQIYKLLISAHICSQITNIHCSLLPNYSYQPNPEAITN